MDMQDYLDIAKEEGRAEERVNTEREKARADQEKVRADQEKLRADAAEAELARLREKLAALPRSRVPEFPVRYDSE